MRSRDLLLPLVVTTAMELTGCAFGDQPEPSSTLLPDQRAGSITIERFGPEFYLLESTAHGVAIPSSLELGLTQLEAAGCEIQYPFTILGYERDSTTVDVRADLIAVQVGNPGCADDLIER